MKIDEIDRDTLLYSYLPVDYCDSFSREFQMNKETPPINPEMFMDITFKEFPFWIKWLLNLRNTLVKPFGLDTDVRFTDIIRAKNEKEIIFGMEDKHLTFYVSLLCGQKEEMKKNTQELRITTIVRYNNWFGRVYFFVIRPFHKIIVRFILNRAVNFVIKQEKLSNY